MSVSLERHRNLDTVLIEINKLREARRYGQILAITSAIRDSDLLEAPVLLLAHAGSLSYMRRHGEALAALMAAETSVRSAADGWLLASWQLLLAIQLVHASRLSSAVSLLLQAIEIAERDNFPKIVADASNSLGVCCSFRGEVDEAIILFKRSLIAWQGLGEPRGVAFAHHNIGLVLREWGHPRRAEEHFQQADLYYSTEGIIEERVSLLAERSLLIRDLGDERLAILLARRAVSESEQLSPVIRASALRALGIVSSHSESGMEGATLLRAALLSLDNERGGLLRAEILEELAVLASYGRWTDASTLRNEALAAYDELGSTRHRLRLLSRLNPGAQSL